MNDCFGFELSTCSNAFVHVDPLLKNEVLKKVDGKLFTFCNAREIITVSLSLLLLRCKGSNS